MTDIRPLSPTRAIRVLRDSVAHALIDQERTRPMEMGTLVDGILFGRPPRVVRVPFDDYRSKAAREARDEAAATGAIVLKNGEEDAITAAVTALAPKLAAFGYLEHHVKLLWQSNGCSHRGEMDAIGRTSEDDRGGYRIGDLKTCEGGAARKMASAGSIVSCGYDVQGMAYVEGLSIARDIDPMQISFSLHFVEITPPYAIVTRTFSPMMRTFGARRWERARQLWLAAFRADNFSPDSADEQVDPPEWAIREEEAHAFSMRGKEPF